MKIISTKLHGILDYVVGSMLVVVPFLVFKDYSSPEFLVPAILGASTLVYSLMTNYELGAVKKIPMLTHLSLDTLSGIFLAASPWLFDFEMRIFWPYLLVGAMEVLIVTLSSMRPYYREVEDLST